MEKKIVPFGTTHNVTVESTSAFLIAVVANDINEGFLLTGHGLQLLPDIGSKGQITFVKGGPMGGYWKFSKAELLTPTL